MRHPPRSTRTDTLFPYATLFRSVVGLAGQAFALPGQVDYRIDNEIGDMHALGPKSARQRFRQDALRGLGRREARETRSEEHTSELQSLMRQSYAVLC